MAADRVRRDVMSKSQPTIFRLCVTARAKKNVRSLRIAISVELKLGSHARRREKAHLTAELDEARTDLA